jgi:nucleotide-binding universal stress UspA family protein
MQTDAFSNYAPLFPTLPVNTKKRKNAPNVIACLGDETTPIHLIKHAQAVAMSLGGNLKLLHVIEPPQNTGMLSDPIEWEISRQETRASIERLATKLERHGGKIGLEVLEGNLIDQICSCIAKRPFDITAFFRYSAGGSRSASSIKRIVESDTGSILMIPADVAGQGADHYTRIVVPLDGSSRAESVVPKAIRIVKANNAELVLCHVTPNAGLTQIAPADAEALKIADQVSRRNKRVASEYLRRVESQIEVCGVRTSSVIVVGDDVRRALTKELERQQASLVILSSHGQSGHIDAAVGDIAGFVLNRCSVPVLMIRQAGKYGARQIFSGEKSAGVRYPTEGGQ